MGAYLGASFVGLLPSFFGGYGHCLTRFSCQPSKTLAWVIHDPRNFSLHSTGALKRPLQQSCQAPEILMVWALQGPAITMLHARTVPGGIFIPSPLPPGCRQARMGNVCIYIPFSPRKHKNQKIKNKKKPCMGVIKWLILLGPLGWQKNGKGGPLRRGPVGILAKICQKGQKPGAFWPKSCLPCEIMGFLVYFLGDVAE